MKHYSGLFVFTCLLGCLLGLLQWGCQKDDYHDFTKGGELIYSSRLDTAIVVPGKDRVKLTMMLKSDPLMDKINIYWNDRQDSMVINAGDRKKDAITVYLTPLSEGNYNFQVYTYDKKGHSSVVFNASGEVYGDGYASALTARPVKSADQSSGGEDYVLYFGRPAQGDIGARIKYQNNKGNAVTVYLSADSARILLPDYQPDSPFTVESMFKPEPDFIDTFFTPVDSMAFPPLDTRILASNLHILPLPTDTKEGGYGWLMEYLWDGNLGTPGMATEDGVPQWFTVDLSSSVALSRLKIWQASDRLYDQQNVKKFEVWGSNAPNMDGSWASWNLIMTCDSYKPSGMPVGQNSQEDIDFAGNGERFAFPAGTPKYRYLRFKLLENWGNGSFMTIDEIGFWEKK